MAAVFFDLDGTLVRFEDGFDAVVERTLTDCGVESGEGNVRAVTSGLLDALGEFAVDPYAAAARGLSVSVDPSAFADAFVRNEVDATVSTEGAVEALEGIEGGCGILSNGVGGVQRRKIDACGLAEHIDWTVVSYDVGAHKPSPEMFAAARERTDHDRHAFVADDFQRDVRPAIDAGFEGVHYDPEGGSAPRSGAETVHSLRAVPDALGM